jgi:predicted ribosome quality control (RQC) complex YloA/Tae2 family protein
MKSEQVSIGNHLITYYIGENAADNFDVIDKAESNADLWFHASEESSCHVVAILPSSTSLDKKIYRQMVKRGALLCKQHTNKIKSVVNTPIVYAPISKVKKGTVIGQVFIQEGGKQVCV